MKNGIIIQARMGSQRLPGKVMKPLAGEPALYRILERLSNCKTIDEIIVATTNNPEDSQIVSLAKDFGVKFYRGSNEDVLLRFYQSATEFSLDVIIRITADCPFIDSEIIDRMLIKFNKLNTNRKHCEYLSNIARRKFPRGLDVEIFSYSVLEKINKMAKNPYDREHVTTYIRNNPKEFKTARYTPLVDNSKYRWTLDEKDDYEFISRVYEGLYYQNPKFRYKDILKYLNQNPELALINSDVKQKSEIKKVCKGRV